jgi:hypothetical protein
MEHKKRQRARKKLTLEGNKKGEIEAGKKWNTKSNGLGKKLTLEGNKKGEIETSFHSLLPNANSLVILQSFKSLFTDSSHVKVGLHLPLFSLTV